MTVKFELPVSELKVSFSVIMQGPKTAYVVFDEQEDFFTLNRVAFREFHMHYNLHNGEWTSLRSYEAWNFSGDGRNRVTSYVTDDLSYGGIHRKYPLKGSFLGEGTYDQKKKVYHIVKKALNDYLNTHPEIIVEADEQQKADQLAQKRAELEKKRADLQALQNEIRQLEQVIAG